MLDASNPWFFDYWFLSIILILVHKINMKTKELISTAATHPHAHAHDPHALFFPFSNMFTRPSKAGLIIR